MEKRIMSYPKGNIPLSGNPGTFFYHSMEYRLMREGVGDLHCMTEDYIVDDLMMEWNGQGRYGT